MRIFIIGGTGLISTATTRALVARGEDVTIFNRGQTEDATAGGVTDLHGDRRDFAAFERQMHGLGTYDCVIDMVCFLPEEAESAVRAFAGRTGQYLFCSTVDVYTKPAFLYPIREDAERQPSLAFPYAYAKGQCEEILWAAHARGDLPVTVIRPAYTYGEGRGMLHAWGAKTTYLDRIRKGKPIVVPGDGQNLWGSCHRDDVGRAFANAAGNAATIGKGYHATGEEWMTWNQYHQRIAAAMGAPPPTLVHIPADLLRAVAPGQAMLVAENFQFNNIFDNTAARTDLGFQYTIPFTEGVRRIVAWLDARNRIENSDDDPFDDRVISAWQWASDQMARQLGPPVA